LRTAARCWISSTHRACLSPGGGSTDTVVGQEAAADGDDEGEEVREVHAAASRSRRRSQPRLRTAARPPPPPRWVRETREVKASPERAHKRCNQPGRKETGKIGVPWGPGSGCFKVRASQALGLGQCSKQEKLQPESAAEPSGHLHKRALKDSWVFGRGTSVSIVGFVMH
jgi:hypothetical protein